MIKHYDFVLRISDANLQTACFFGTYEHLYAFARNFDYWQIVRIKDNCVISRAYVHYINSNMYCNYTYGLQQREVA